MTAARRSLATAAVVIAWLAAAPFAFAAGQCGNQKDTCKCGKNNPYPCCDNGSNCTWWAWHEACCNWGIGLPGWGNANTWHSYAKQNPNFTVLSHPVPGSIATSTAGQYGHVAWVIAVGNGTVTVREMNCCGSCPYGMITRTHKTSYFNSGFVVPKQQGPVCGQGGCESGESCANCPQDCGSCCGNGKCDNGESCSSCSKDCGSCCGNGKCDNGESCGSCAQDCPCPPEGALELAGCGACRGYARDPNEPSAALQVRLEVDGTGFATLQAGEAHVSQGAHGFAAATPADLHDGAVHQIRAVARESDGKGEVVIGSLPLRCRQGAWADGPWRTLASPISGLDARVRGAGSAPDAALVGVTHLCGLDHLRSASDVYALSGQLDSCLRPGAQPFDGALVELQATTTGTPLEVSLRIDGDELRKVAAQEAGQTVALDRPGSQLCLRSVVKAEVQASAAASIALRGVRFRSAGWWHGVESTGHGLLLLLRAAEGVSLLAEPAKGLPGVVGSSGAVRVWRTFNEPFDMIRGEVKAHDPRAQARLLVHPEATDGPLLIGSFEQARLSPRTTLALRLARPQDADGSGAMEAGTLLSLQGVRLARHGETSVGAFDVGFIAAFGLRALSTEAAAKAGLTPGAGRGLDKETGGASRPGASADPGGLPSFGRDIVLAGHDAGWWATGTLRATLRDGSGRFERARLSLRPFGATAGLQLRAVGLQDGEVAAAPAGAGSTVQAVPLELGGAAQLELDLDGDRLGLELAWAQDSWQPAGGSVRIEGVALRRAGWWSLPSAEASGLSDGRPGGDAVRMQASQGQVAVHGALLLLRELDGPQRALRLKLRQHLPIAALRLAVLLDGIPAAVLEEPGPVERIVTITPLAAPGAVGVFHDIGLLLQRKQAPMPAGEFYVEASAFELQGLDGVWRPLKTVKLREAAALQPQTMAAAATPVGDEGSGFQEVGGGASAGPAGQGCGASPAAGANRAGTGSMALLFLVFAAWLSRRRAPLSRPRSPPPA